MRGDGWGWPGMRRAEGCEARRRQARGFAGENANLRRWGMVTRKDLFILIFFVFIIFSVVFLFSGCKNLNPLVGYEDDLDSYQTKVLRDFLIKTQSNEYTCGITSITMVNAYLNEDYTVEELIDKYDLSLKGGMTSSDFRDQLNTILGDGYGVRVYENISNSSVLDYINCQLGQGLPVPVFYVAPNPYNKPKYDIHSSVVIGINCENETVQVANPYGYVEDLTLTIFLNRMNLLAGDLLPFMQTINIRLGIVKPNTIFLINEK